MISFQGVWNYLTGKFDRDIESFPVETPQIIPSGRDFCIANGEIKSIEIGSSYLVNGHPVIKSSDHHSPILFSGCASIIS